MMVFKIIGAVNTFTYVNVTRYTAGTVNVTLVQSEFLSRELFENVSQSGLMSRKRKQRKKKEEDKRREEVEREKQKEAEE